MRYLVALIATAVIALSALGVVAPERVTSMVSAWPSATRFYVAVGTRLVLGVIFLAAGRRCRLPAVIYAVGTLSLAAAVILVFLGGPAVDALVQLWSAQPAVFIRAWCTVGVLLGLLILYSAGQRPSLAAAAP